MKTQKNARERLIRYSILVAVMCVLTFFCSTTIHATVSSKANVDHVEGTSEAKTQDPDSPQDFQFNISSNAGSTSLSASMKMLLVLTVLSLAPFIIIMVTSFTRIIVVLHFLVWRCFLLCLLCHRSWRRSILTVSSHMRQVK